MKYRTTGCSEVIHLTVKSNLLYNRKLMELWLVRNTEMNIKVCLKDYRSEYIFSLRNFTANNQEKFRTNSAVYSINTRHK
jgi:hypothetical protein